jgi:pimeloyl-ACP methyl ester carboxylesterase
MPDKKNNMGPATRPLPGRRIHAAVAAKLAATAPDVLARLTLADADARANTPSQPSPNYRGDAAWLEQRGNRPLTVVNTRTGNQWERSAAGWWEPFHDSRRRTLVDQLGVLLASRDDQVATIVRLLRQDPRPAADLMREATQVAVQARRGVDLARVHITRSKALGELDRTDPTPHRLVEHVHDLPALLSSCDADIDTAVDPQWAAACRHQLARFEARGDGRFTFADLFPTRTEAVTELGRHLRWRRPGQRFYIEPGVGGLL